MVNFADLPVLPDTPMLVAASAAVLGSGYLVWKMMGAAVKVMFFVAAFVLGAGVTYAFSTVTGHPQPTWVYAGDGLAFAWVCSLIRAKVARIIGGLIVIGITQVMGCFGHTDKPEPKPAPAAHAKKSPTPKG